MPQLTPKELDQIRNSMAAAEDSVVIAMIKVVLSGGIDKVHPELLRIITDEINARGLSDQLMNESRRRKPIKLTKRQLQRIISNVIVESYAHTQQRPSLSLDKNQAIQDHLKGIEHEFYKEFYSGDHDEAMERIREVIEQEYIKAHENSSYWAKFNDRQIQ